MKISVGLEQRNPVEIKRPRLEALVFYGRDKIQMLKTFEQEGYITKATF